VSIAKTAPAGQRERGTKQVGDIAGRHELLNETNREVTVNLTVGPGEVRPPERRRGRHANRAKRDSQRVLNARRLQFDAFSTSGIPVL
jgi:hypothetical protein